jgi:hypothetical protein
VAFCVIVVIIILDEGNQGTIRTTRDGNIIL